MTATHSREETVYLMACNIFNYWADQQLETLSSEKNLLDHPITPHSTLGQDSFLYNVHRTLFSLISKVLSLEFLITSFRRLFPSILGCP